jgi:hypothetical protein
VAGVAGWAVVDDRIARHSDRRACESTGQTHAHHPREALRKANARVLADLKEGGTAGSTANFAGASLVII